MATIMDMFARSTKTAPRPCSDSIEAALAHWKQRLAELPEVRSDKVQSVRGAIQRSSYESEQLLESTVQRLSNDVGVLCRKDPSAGPA